MIPQSTETPEPLVPDERLELLREATNAQYFTKIKRNGPASWLSKKVRDIYESERSKDKARIASLEAQVKAMREAGQAVVKRWDDPKWEWDKHGHTASLIADLRKSLDTPTPTPPNK